MGMSVIFRSPSHLLLVAALKADDQTLRTEGLTDEINSNSIVVIFSAWVATEKSVTWFCFRELRSIRSLEDRYRTGLEVDASGQLFGEVNFQDVTGFKEAITNEKNRFVAAFVQHLLSYALGQLTWADGWQQKK